MLFILADIGAAGSFIFYDALLPHVATAGYALGYLGGRVLLAINLACIQYPAFFGPPNAAAAARLSFLSLSLWWLLFSMPLFRQVVEGQKRRARWAASAGFPSPTMNAEKSGAGAHTSRGST